MHDPEKPHDLVKNTIFKTHAALPGPVTNEVFFLLFLEMQIQRQDLCFEGL
ncbi:MAG: hypothetical protein ACTSWN_08055 [Promethearchaeota archaeon]